MKKKSIVLWSVIGAVIVGIVIYNLPYFKEMRAYNDAVEENTIYAYCAFLNDYPHGRYAEEAMMHKINLADVTLDRLNYAQDYIEEFPDGKYADIVNVRIDSIWDEEIRLYKDNALNRGSEEVTEYVLDMLEYMKRNRINTIVVDVNPWLDLRDYNEFDKDARSLIEILDDSGLSYKTDMVSLRLNFDQGAVDELTNILVDGVEKSFASIFVNGVINVKPNVDINECDDENLIESPKITFAYKIVNQVDSIGNMEFPGIWTYSEDRRPKKLLLGIDVWFDAEFTIPGRSEKFVLHDKGEPEDKFNGIENISEGYSLMTKSCFMQFSDKIISLMGLD